MEKHTHPYLPDFKEDKHASSVNITSVINRYLPDEKPLGILLAFVVLLIAAAIGINYRPGARGDVKSVQLAGISISNKDIVGANKELIKAGNNQTIKIVIKDTTYSYKNKDLGIKRDTSYLLGSAYAKPASIVDKKLASQQITGLKTYVQKNKLLAAVNKNIDAYKTTQDSRVGVDGPELLVYPGRAGIDIDFDQLVKQLESSDLSPTITVVAAFTQQQPAIPTEAAEAAKIQAENLLKLSYGISTISNGTQSATQAQKAGWLDFVPDQIAHKINVSMSAEAAKVTMSALAQSYVRSPKEKITLTNGDGSSTMLEDGQTGLAIDQTSLSGGLSQFASSVSSRKSFNIALNLNEEQPDVRNLGTSIGGKFVLVDLADYKAYAINNTDVDKTMLVSTGRKGMETPKGHFQITSKTRLITMQGCNSLVGCWSVPKVPNAEFFTKDGDALHGTYWHNQFGKANLSHGCVNLTLADAAWLYDWTSVGTDVIVV